MSTCPKCQHNQNRHDLCKMNPKNYRNKPVVIQAMQFTPETRYAVIAWCGARHTWMGEDGSLFETANLFINTLEGEMMARPGDYIIKGVKGEFYPCKPDIFEATNEEDTGEQSDRCKIEQQRQEIERLRKLVASCCDPMDATPEESKQIMDCLRYVYPENFQGESP